MSEKEIKETSAEVVEAKADEKSQKTKPAKKTKKPSKFKKWFRELKAEAKKVIWPSKPQVINNTLVVLATVLMAMLFILALDFVFGFITDLLISLG